MAYLDNTVITVDAVLTKLGRERLSQGQFTITKWAVSDDEIDYSLYNTAHPLGTDYYSNIIESMPVLEAIPDESQALRYKLRSGTTKDVTLPKISIQGQDPDTGNYTISSLKSFATTAARAEAELADYVSAEIRPSTANFDGSEPYVITLFNENIATLVGLGGEPLGVVAFPTSVATLESVDTSVDVTTTTSGPTPVSTLRNYSTTQVKTLTAGAGFAIEAKLGVNSQTTTKVRITGVETGVTKTLTITINPA